MFFDAQRSFAGLAVAALVAVSPSVVRADVAPEAKRVLDNAERAIRDASSFSYSARVYGDGAIANQFDVRGDVVLVRGADTLDNSPQSYRGTAKVMGQELSFNAATDGRIVMWPVEAEATLYERPMFERRNGGQTMLQQARLLRLDNLLRPEPFAAEMADGNTVRLAERQQVGGVMCDVVEVTTAAGTGMVRWYFGAEDSLPRKREMISGGSPQGGSQPVIMVTELSSIQAGELKPADLVMETPAGFTRARWTDPRDAEGSKAGIEAGLDTNEPTAVASGPTVGQTAPALKIDLVSGGSFDLADRAGRAVVLCFIDPRLVPCIRAAETLNKIAQDYAERPVDIVVLAARQPGAQTIEAFRDNGITLKLATDAADIATRYNVKGFPTFVVVDGQGRVANVEVGLDDIERLDRRMRVGLDRLTR